MSVETNEEEPKQQNGEQPVNGISNGHSADVKEKTSSSSGHKSSSKDKHRDKDRDKDRSHKSSSKSGSSSHRSDKDKEKSSSSSSKDRHSSSHKSSSGDKQRDKDKDKHRDKDKERDKNRDKDKERSDKDKSSSSSSKDKDKHRSSSKSSHRDKEKEGGDKDKERSDKDKSSSSSSSKDKERHRSSSKSSHRDKDKGSSSSKSSSSHRDKDKERSSSSSKHRDSSSSSSRQKDKDKEKKPKLSLPGPEPLPITQTANNNTATVGDGDPLGGDERPRVEGLEISESQASSIDYSMSQFRDDEPRFTQMDIESIKAGGDKTEYSDEEIKKEVSEEDEEEDVKPVKIEEDSDEDVPLSKRKKEEPESDDSDVPLTARKKVKKEKVVKQEKSKKKAKRSITDDEDEDDDYDEPRKSKKLKKEKNAKPIKKELTTPSKTSPTKATPGKRAKKETEPEEVWKWWEEEKKNDGTKWTFLEHKGPVFAPEYERLPSSVKFFYDKKEIKLSEGAEEVAGFYAKMLEHEYTSKKVFNDNFFKDWRKFMSDSEKKTITDLFKCNFKPMHAYFAEVSERNRNRTKEEKKALKEQNEDLIKEYGFCIIDGHKERIGNFRIEPPGLFRGRGEHPKMGMVKCRVMPEDVIINCSKDSAAPKAPDGHRWKKVQHDNTVSWLASWTENVQGQVKYVMLNPSSKLKGEKDWQKYETARKLQKSIGKIRETYREEWKSKEMRIRQRAVALYFIDKLALRAGNEKDEDQADTVGCCSLRVEHIELHKELNGKENVVVFDFLGKDSIRYYNEVEIEKRVYKNLELFKETKKDGDDLFDRLNTSVLNEHLRDLMEGLTAKVFRTFNASFTLQNQLDELTDPNSSVPEKLLSYNRANRAVAILCNHQRAVPKGHSKSMENLKEKIKAKKDTIKECEKEFKDIKRGGNAQLKDKKKKQIDRLKEQLQKLELQETDRDENKTIALGTSKLNYLDPRISVAWCKKHDVPIEKIFNKTQREKFRWAIDMADENYRF